MNHELNNSLAPIRSLAHSARQAAARPEHSAMLEPILATIEERATHLAGFLEGYARFARLPRPRPEAVSWSEFLDGVHALVPFRLEGEPPAERAWFDPAQMQQVLINLLKNAHESGGDPAEVAVSVLSTPHGETALREAQLEPDPRFRRFELAVAHYVRGDRTAGRLRPLLSCGVRRRCDQIRHRKPAITRFSLAPGSRGHPVRVLCGGRASGGDDRQVLQAMAMRQHSHWHSRARVDGGLGAWLSCAQSDPFGQDTRYPCQLGGRRRLPSQRFSRTSQCLMVRRSRKQF